MGRLIMLLYSMASSPRLRAPRTTPKLILSACELLEEFDYSVLDRTIVVEQESGEEVALRYWLEYGDAAVAKAEEHKAGWSLLRMESREGGSMLLAIPNGKADKMVVIGHVLTSPGSVTGMYIKTLHTNDENTVFKAVFKSGKVAL